MALAGKMLAARFPEQKGLFDFRVFGIASDGDLMEGISHEAASLAGHLGLDNLIFFYDDNHISIDGETELALSDDAAKRFEAYGWFVQRIDGHDPQQIRAALDAAVAEPARPSLIIARTHIGHGSPNKQDSEKSHGSPLGKEEVALTKKAAGWPEEPTFLVPDEVRKVFEGRTAELASDYAAWQQQVHAALDGRPSALCRRVDRAARSRPTWSRSSSPRPRSSRASRSRRARSAARSSRSPRRLCPWLVGGSADLNPSTNTYIVGSPSVKRGEYGGRNIHYGVREHGMSSINNGLAASGFTPLGSTFLVFADYLRPAIRLAALTTCRTCSCSPTTRSSSAKTDRPTSRSRRSRPFASSRTCAWCGRPTPGSAPPRGATPSAASTGRRCSSSRGRSSRRSTTRASALAILMTGAYRVIDPPDATMVMIATGSEVQLAIAAAKALAAEGKPLRVISAPCLEALEDAGEAPPTPRCSPTTGCRASRSRPVAPTVAVRSWGARASRSASTRGVPRRPTRTSRSSYGLTPDARDPGSRLAAQGLRWRTLSPARMEGRRHVLPPG